MTHTHRITSIDDPRVAAYRNLRDRTLRGESLFVAEGLLVVRRLLASRFEAESVFVAEQHAEEFAPLAGPKMPVYVAPESLLREVVGFPFHRGALAAGRRATPLGLDEMLSGNPLESPLRLIACPKITNQENMGLVFRTAAGFGVDGVLLGQWCCDPFSRRCLRLSMGAAFHVPFVKTDDFLADLRQLKDRWGVRLVAAVLDDRAAPLSELKWPPRVGLLLGNEFEGLAGDCLALCDHRATIPMRPGVDSLNLGVAAGIFVYEMCRAAKPAP